MEAEALLRVLQKQLAEAGKIAGLPSDKLERILTFDREIKVSVQLRRDTGELEFYEGLRVQHSRALGPYKGGIRFHPQVSLAELKVLALLMSLKNALIGLPFGGAKGGIALEPSKLSKKEQERLTRALTRGLADFLGPYKDVPAPDVGTTPAHMGWLADEYAKLTGRRVPAVVTGKTPKDGGTALREASTGLGGALILEEFLRHTSGKPKETSLAIQGFGNVGSHLALNLDERGFVIKALSEFSGGLFHEDGLDVSKTLKAKLRGEILKKTCFCKSHDSGNCSLTSCQLLSNDKLLALPVAVLAPSAIEGTINQENASKVRAKVILEMANAAVTPEAEKILVKRGVVVIPDILANAGGVVVSYFEWYQNLRHRHWRAHRVEEELIKRLSRVFHKVWQLSQAKNCSLRQAALALALKRLAKKTTIE